MRQSTFARVRRKVLHAFCFVLLVQSAGTAQTAGAKFSCTPGTTEYEVSLRERVQHLLRVRISIPTGVHGERDLQLPAWNATYQVRDFAQNVFSVSAKDENGQPLRVVNQDKTTWHVSSGRDRGCVIADYEVFLDDAGPFGAQINEDHAFINWAQALMYSPESRSDRVRVRISDLPQSWKVRDAYVFAGADQPGAVAVDGEAANYDSLVDSPVEMGTFAEAAFEQGGAQYRVVVHGSPADYDMRILTGAVQKIVAAETEWMRDRPFGRYTFIYHFPHGPAAGGMEHAYSTAIDVSGLRMAQNPMAFAGVTAHEFFHLWNVKRIRPQSLEPIDYTKEMYTHALWFSEGVTSSVQEYMLVRSGLIDGDTFLQHLAEQISMLQERPAHRAQSAEESSLDAWLEKYPSYLKPERSISYYNKGQILGVLLDLRMREVSGGSKSLRDLFLYMNANYAKRHAFFDDSEGIRKAAEEITGADLREFFARYVAGTDEIPYGEFFRSVGLKLSHRTIKVPYLGFSVSRAPGQPAAITRLDPNSQGAQAGLVVGDVVLAVNGNRVIGSAAAALAGLQPDETATLKVRGRTRGERDIKLMVESRDREDYALEDIAGITPAQRARRTAWMRGDSEVAQNTPAKNIGSHSAGPKKNEFTAGSEAAH